MPLKKQIQKEKHLQTSQEGTDRFLQEPALVYEIGGAGRYLGIAGGTLYGPNQKEKQLMLIRGGLTRGALDILMEKTGLSIYELADILEVTDRTLRRYASDEVLNKRLSERAFEIANLYDRGEQVFGDAPSFRQWMSTEVPALGHRTPKSFLDTSMGIQMLMDELGRIEHGVFA
ncbi:MAG TPA: antitoxin Xre/MbcA/ParS toxin-binding domain-containing protein [Phnomibacter sp.]|nr:antitoxin Xre/MbcA/ParS toxin-binding domain-containing protein [Phnomibacter sp.]